jgi:ATP-dependent DNA helicase RecQ
MKIFTFHSFAISLLGKKIDNEQTSLHNIINQATVLLENDEIDLPYIQLLVLDEYQDVGANTYNFIKTIYSKMAKDKKIIAVGDDDQCINNFGNDKADISFINQYQRDFEQYDEENISSFSRYSLLTNYRSKKNIVDFSNHYSSIIPNKLKVEPLVSFSKEYGEIHLINYKDTSYIQNIVNQVIEDESETIAILSRNNDEVLTIYSQLIANGVKAKYITSKDGFSLGNLIELQEFLSFWQQNNLEESREKFDIKYKTSKNYRLANNVIENFINEYEEDIESSQKYFVTFFEEYLKDIEFEEFEYSKVDVIVSTMHKAKGKEFDSVYLCMDENFIKDDYEKRLLYVAITRAKKRLTIHTKDNVFNFMGEYCNTISEYTKFEPEPNRIVFVMGLGDIALSNKYSASGIRHTNPISGEKAHIIQGQFGFEIHKNGKQIGKLSGINPNYPNRLSNKINQKLQQRYSLEQEVDIDYVVNWFDKTTNENYKQVLCKVYMIKEPNF